MSELKPLDITDNRTPEQVRADGDERWPDGRPYILRGVCCVCGVNVEQERENYPVHVCLIKLGKVQPCGCEFQMHGELTTCSQPAYWLLNGCPVCDEDIREIAGMNSDNETFLAPALAEIAQMSGAVAESNGAA